MLNSCEYVLKATLHILTEFPFFVRFLQKETYDSQTDILAAAKQMLFPVSHTRTSLGKAGLRINIYLNYCG